MGFDCFYHIKLTSGQRESGVVQVQSKDEFMTHCRGIMGLVLQVREAMPWDRYQSRVKRSELVQILRDLRLGLEVGFDLIQAVQFAAPVSRSFQFRYAISLIKSGVSLSKALWQSRICREPLVHLKLEIAFETGALQSALKVSETYLSWQIEMRRLLKTSLAYPLFVLCFTLCLVMFLVTSLVPNLISLYNVAGYALPLETKVFLNLIEAVPFILLVFAVTTVFIGGLFLISKSRKQVHGPVLKKICFKLKTLQKISQFYFFKSLSFLYGSGRMDIIQAIEKSISFHPLPAMSASYQSLIQDIQNGCEVHKAMKTSLQLSESETDIIRVGEHANQMDSSFHVIASRLEESFMQGVNKTVRVLGPAVLMLVGFIILGTVSCLILPLYDSLGGGDFS